MMNHSLEQCKITTGRLLRSRGGVSLALALTAVVVYCWPGATLSLQYDATTITGEYWRFFTGHWTHWSLDHLFWDVLVFAVLGVWCERLCPRRFVACLLGATFTIPAVICFLQPQLQTYRGLSGIDSALFVLLAITVAGQSMADREMAVLSTTVLLMFAFAAKLAFEMVTRSTIFVDSTGAAFVPVPLAHLTGAVVGLACASRGRLSEVTRAFLPAISSAGVVPRSDSTVIARRSLRFRRSAGRNARVTLPSPSAYSPIHEHALRTWSAVSVCS